MGCAVGFGVNYHARAVRAYMTTAEWLMTDDYGDRVFGPRSGEFETSYPEWDPTSLAEITVDMYNFIGEVSEHLDACDIDAGQCGMDFYLTRNRHGAGFWDRDHPAPHGDALTEAAKAYGETYEYLGDDGKVYAS